MRTIAVLIASCCLVAGRLWADPVNYTITNLTAAMSDLTVVSFSGSGPSITITGLEGTPETPFPTSPGEPVNPGGLGFGLGCESPPAICTETGLAGNTPVNLEGSPEITTTGGVVTFQASTLIYTLPAVATGEFSAVCPFGATSCVPGTVVGNVFLDLPGYLTYQFASVGPDEYALESESFTATPEPSSAALWLIGFSLMGGAAFRRGRKVKCGNGGF